ncbi:MAG: hypothetical protein ACU0GG_07295 [Paracoccaceae bacterium]
MSASVGVTKLKAAKTQIEAAILLLFLDTDSEPAHTLVWASRNLLWDLNKVSPNNLVERIETAVKSRVKPEYYKVWKQYENRAANFLKHADRDPNKTLVGVDLRELNRIQLLLNVLAYSHYESPLSSKMVAGLSYCGFLSQDVFDFRGCCKDLGVETDFDYFASMNEMKRRYLFLGSFLHAHDPIGFPLHLVSEIGTARLT